MNYKTLWKLPEHAVWATHKKIQPTSFLRPFLNSHFLPSLLLIENAVSEFLFSYFLSLLPPLSPWRKQQRPNSARCPSVHPPFQTSYQLSSTHFLILPSPCPLNLKCIVASKSCVTTNIGHKTDDQKLSKQFIRSHFWHFWQTPMTLCLWTWSQDPLFGPDPWVEKDRNGIKWYKLNKMAKSCNVVGKRSQ